MQRQMARKSDRSDRNNAKATDEQWVYHEKLLSQKVHIVHEQRSISLQK